MMGRGLSDFQTHILFMASDKIHEGRRESRGWQAGNWPDLFISEILVEFFWWKPERHGSVLGCHHFSKTAIGEEHYNATMATISRAIRRLDERGLVRRDRKLKGIFLTPSGEETIERIRLETVQRIESRYNG